MIEKETYSKQIDTSSEAVLAYMQSMSSLDSLPDIINQGLNVLKGFPDTLTVSLFILDKDSYEFVHRASIPYSFKNEATELYECLVEYGTIGMALETSKIARYPNKKSGNCNGNCVVIPLIASGGPIGIIIQTFIKLSDELEFYKIKITAFFASIFSNKLENSFLIAQLRRDHSLLEQKIASRSMDLSQSNRELQAIFQSVDTAIIVIDIVSDRIVNVNDTAYKIIGLKYGELLEKSSSAFFEMLESRDVIDEQVKFSRNFEDLIIRPDGGRIPILRAFSNINIANKRYRIESFSEITEQKRKSQELIQSNELLELKVQERTEDLNETVQKLKNEIYERKIAEEKLSELLSKEKDLNYMKTQFISMISHEFRTPMTLINSAAQMLKKFRSQLSDEDVDNYLTRILKSVDNMTGMIENVIFLGKSDSASLSFQPRSVDICKIAKEIVNESIILYGTERQINLECNVDEGLAMLDEDLIRQIFINLLTNALKYSPDDSQVEFNIIFDGETCVFIVQDYGIGIPQSEQTEIFELFHRASNVGNISGTGLGLAVVKRALELHGGNMELKSISNQGTIFKIIISLKNYG